MGETPLTRAALASRLDQMMLGPGTTRAEIEQLCGEAMRHRLYSVAVSGSRVDLAAALLEESPVKVTCLVGYPWGAAEADTKRFEAEAAIDAGAQEIEMVLNVGRLKDGDSRYVLRELRDVAEAADERPVTVILETSSLTPEQRQLACALALDSGVHAVGTGVGFTAATVEEVAALRAAVGEKFGVKAAGISDTNLALALLAAGATRIGSADAASLVLGLPG
jgi:deoxyribose-phosphate aldolase